MAKIPRVAQKQFGASGPTGDFGEFSSLAAGGGVNSKDPASMQSLAGFLTGWAASVVGVNVPPLEDMNCLFYLAFYQLCYLFQAGISEYDSTTTYYIGSLVQISGVVYKSNTDYNLNNNPATDNGTNWVLYPLNGAALTNLAGTLAGAGRLPQANMEIGANYPFVIENRTSDPVAPATGRIWYRTDV